MNLVYGVCVCQDVEDVLHNTTITLLSICATCFALESLYTLICKHIAIFYNKILVRWNKIRSCIKQVIVLSPCSFELSFWGETNVSLLGMFFEPKEFFSSLNWGTISCPYKEKANSNLSFLNFSCHVGWLIENKIYDDISVYILIVKLSYYQ